jgi:hypothetical protein
MSDYLRRRFPLGDTSTVYMSGKGAYDLVGWGTPGVIASVELTANQAEAFRTAVRRAMAEAWDDGAVAGLAAYSVDDCGPNPYRHPPAVTP